MARPRKPTHLKLIEGNPGKRPLNKNEPKPKPQIPACPTWLNADAKRTWKRLAPELEKIGLLTIVDKEAFAAACQSYGVWVECERILKSSGRTLTRETKSGMYEIARPEVGIGDSALKNFKAFCTEFGLTPSARSGIEIPTTDKDSEEFKMILSGQHVLR